MSLIQRKCASNLAANTPHLAGALARFSSLMLALYFVTGTASLFSQSVVGLQPFGSYLGNFDSVNLADLGVHIDIPLFVHKARGANNGISIHLIYDGSYYNSPPTGDVDFGWRVVASSAGANETLSAQEQDFTCPYSNQGTYQNWTYYLTDGSGYRHAFPGSSIQNVNNCQNISSNTLDAYAIDGSGYHLTNGYLNSGIVIDRSGTRYDTANNDVIDANGNVGYPLSLQDTSNVSVQITGGHYVYNNYGVPTSRTPLVVQYTDSNAASQQIVVAYKLYTYGNIGGWGLVDSVTFPDTSSYHFTYQSSAYSPGYCNSSISGLIASIQLPTGGVIGYQNTFSQTCGNTCPDKTLVRTTSDGSTSYSNTGPTSLLCSRPSTTTITYPDSSGEVINNVPVLNNVPVGVITNGNVETSHYWYDASGFQVKSSMRCYNGATGNCTTTAVSFPISQIASTATLVSGLSAKTVEFLNGYGLQTELDEYDYSASTPTRKTVTTYWALQNNIVDRPNTVTVSDGANNIFTQTTYTYDEYSLAHSGITGLATINGSRGNLTSVSRRVSATASPIATHAHYDDAGQTVSTTDGNNFVTSYAHDITDTYVTLTTYPPVTRGTFSVQSTPDSETGLILQSKDMNSQITAHTYDSMLRNVGVCNADGGYTQTVYTSTSLTTNVLTGTGAGCIPTGGVPSGTWITSSSQYDAYGRLSHSIDAAGNTADNGYDQMGRKYSVSNPYAPGGTTDGTVYYLYDSLGRPAKQTDQDGALQYWCYDGHADPHVNQPNCHPHIGSKIGSWVDFQDEAGHQWQRTTDALGRLVEVAEPNGSIAAASMETDYSYDPLGNLLQVSQFGGPTNSPTLPGPEYRYFTYDNLSRLVTSYNPESGWTCYGTTAPPPQNPVPPTASNCTSGPSGYDGNGNLINKTDARGVRVQYTYDALNRLTNKSYFVPTQTPVAYATTSNVTYNYDEPSGVFMNGRRTSMTDGAGSQNWVYDKVGRVGQITRRTITPLSPASSPQTNPANFTYDLAGHLTKGVFFALGSSYQYSYDTTGRATGLNWNGTATYVSGVSYKPSGQLMGMVLGDNGTIPNKITETFGYNNRLQPASVVAGTSSTTLFNHSYCYSACFTGAQLANNGNLIEDIDNSSAAASVNYSYDTLDRLSTAAASHSSPPWSESDVYDAYGNLSQKTDVVNGLQTTVFGSSTALNQLQLPGNLPLYDLAGNVRKDNFSTQFTWDAENRMASAGSVAYSYDGDGKRVVKYNPNAANGSLGSVYWYGADGSLTDETTVALNGSNPRDLQRIFYFNGKLVARQGFPASFFPNLFIISDQLGSSRLAVDFTWNGTNPPLETLNYLPFGGYVTNPPTNDTLDPKFTGHVRDGGTGEPGVDYFGARYYTSSMSRFMSPDWSDSSDPVPYADLGDPQSLNLYSYAGNNPLSNVDSDGHIRCDPSTFEQKGDAYELKEGECHLEWSDFHNYLISQYELYKNQIAEAAKLASNAAHQIQQVASTPGGARCMGGLALGGAMVGGGHGAVVGLAGGPAAEVTVPGGATIGAFGGGSAGVALAMTVCPGGAASGGAGGGDEGGDKIPGRPFRGKDAPERAFKNLEENHGVSPEVASERLHKIKSAAGLGPADDVVIGRTGDVYIAANGEWIGSLTMK